MYKRVDVFGGGGGGLLFPAAVWISLLNLT